MALKSALKSIKKWERMNLVIILPFESEIDLNRWVLMVKKKKKIYLSGFAIRFMVVITEFKPFMWSWLQGCLGHLAIVIRKNEIGSRLWS